LAAGRKRTVELKDRLYLGTKSGTESWTTGAISSFGRGIDERIPELRRVRPAVALKTGPERSSSH
jgi:hypothetical protein